MNQPIDNHQFESLLRHIELAIGHRPNAPRGFKWLSQAISQGAHEKISATTLKRLWGYDKSGNKPYRHTLDLLARFLRYRDFDAFCSERDDLPMGGVNQMGFIN